MSDTRRRRRSNQSCGSDDLSDSYEELNATKETQVSSSRRRCSAKRIFLSRQILRRPRDFRAKVRESHLGIVDRGRRLSRPTFSALRILLLRIIYIFASACTLGVSASSICVLTSFFCKCRLLFEWLAKRILMPTLLGAAIHMRYLWNFKKYFFCQSYQCLVVKEDFVFVACQKRFIEHVIERLVAYTVDVSYMGFVAGKCI